MSFKSLLRKLRKECPTKLPVRVYRRKLNDCDGYTDAKYNEENKPIRLIIVIASNMSLETQKDTLMHEYAHALAWKEDTEDHGKEWGLAMSKVYQTIVEK